jgi:hypothetical protein
MLDKNSSTRWKAGKLSVQPSVPFNMAEHQREKKLNLLSPLLNHSNFSLSELPTALVCLAIQISQFAFGAQDLTRWMLRSQIGLWSGFRWHGGNTSELVAKEQLN